MYPFEERLNELLECLCDCENYFECEWHQRLRGFGSSGIVDLKQLEDDMEDERDRRHFFHVFGHDIDDELHPEVQEDMRREGKAL